MYKFKDFVYSAIEKRFDDLEENETLIITLEYCNDFILNPCYEVFDDWIEFDDFLESPEEKEIHYIISLTEEYLESKKTYTYHNEDLVESYEMYLKEMLKKDITSEEKKEIIKILTDWGKM